MTLQEFLNKGESVKSITKDIIVGERFKDENGKDMPFKIKALTSGQLDTYRVRAREGDKFNIGKFNADVVIAGCIYPNFKDAESIKLRNVNTPEEYLRDVLLPGEVDAISLEIQKICGYNISVNELIEEAKN